MNKPLDTRTAQAKTAGINPDQKELASPDRTAVNADSGR